jgi:4-hydroxybenzoate polyprenyltransferase
VFHPWLKRWDEFMANRWWTYQRERFPIVGHGPVIAAFSFSAVCFSSLLRGDFSMPDLRTVVVAFGTAFLFFLQLRIADEFKDFEEDSRYRPYRPVPRGLVKLWELAVVFVLAAGIQLGLALWLDASLLPLLVVTWVYLALMSKEFFVANWLKERHVLYMLSHMAIVPLVDFYATACDWRPRVETPPPDLLWFVAVSYFNGLVIEMGRKIRGPQEEEEGVSTYSRIWGMRNAALVWLGAMFITAVLAGVAASRIDWCLPVVIVVALMLFGAGLVVRAFLRDPSAKRGKWIETFSGLWTLSLYLILGAIPLVWRWAEAASYSRN